jgi:methylated-DNA-[protein]-cysteine S-methyltransferase
MRITGSTVYDVFETALGWVALVASGRGVVRMSLPERTRERALEAVQPDVEKASFEPEAVDELRDLVRRYCAGELVDLTTVALDLEGVTPFFARAWSACRTIPAGETRTYAWLAVEAGSPRASRGAGQAMARNRFPLLVPCHRVVGSDGGLHGFGGGVGLPMKSRLLNMEARTARQTESAAS